MYYEWCCGRGGGIEAALIDKKRQESWLHKAIFETFLKLDPD